MRVKLRDLQEIIYEVLQEYPTTKDNDILVSKRITVAIVAAEAIKELNE